MDMGEILAEWDKMQKSGGQKNSCGRGGKKANADHLVKNSCGQSGQKQSAAEKIDRQQKADNSRQINPMVAWLNRYGVVDKDKMLDEAVERKKFESHTYLRQMRHEAAIDLHGLTVEEAEKKLDAFVGMCCREGLRKILIIHGKGNHSKGSDPVLGNMVHKFIEWDKRLGMSGHPERKDGGSGATWVIIRQK